MQDDAASAGMIGCSNSREGGGGDEASEGRQASVPPLALGLGRAVAHDTICGAQAANGKPELKKKALELKPLPRRGDAATKPAPAREPGPSAAAHAHAIHGADSTLRPRVGAEDSGPTESGGKALPDDPAASPRMRLDGDMQSEAGASLALSPPQFAPLPRVS